jgi:hypothetical protein
MNRIAVAVRSLSNFSCPGLPAKCFLFAKFFSFFGVFLASQCSVAEISCVILSFIEILLSLL